MKVTLAIALLALIIASGCQNLQMGSENGSHYVTVAWTLDVDVKAKIVNLFKRNKIQTTHDGEGFGVVICVPPDRKLQAIHLMKSNGFSDFIWNQNGT